MIYHCAGGHEIVTPEPLTIDRCLVTSCSDPYNIIAVAEGSRAENARLKGLAIERRNQAYAKVFDV